MRGRNVWHAWELDGNRRLPAPGVGYAYQWCCERLGLFILYCAINLTNFIRTTLLPAATRQDPIGLGKAGLVMMTIALVVGIARRN